MKTEGGFDVLLGRLGAEVQECSGGDLDGSAIGASMRQVGLLEALAEVEAEVEQRLAQDAGMAQVERDQQAAASFRT